MQCVVVTVIAAPSTNIGLYDSSNTGNGAIPGRDQGVLHASEVDTGSAACNGNGNKFFVKTFCIFVFTLEAFDFGLIVLRNALERLANNENVV